jgi:hypothetical protein
MGSLELEGFGGMMGVSRRGRGMKLRIAIWAGVGALVVALWNLAVVPGLSMIALALAYLSCPIVALARHHAISFYVALFINAVTYALIGAAVETMRRHRNQTRSVSN